MRYALRFVLAILLLVGCGAAYEQLSERLDRTRIPQIGQSIAIGPRALNIFCSGEGTPSVIFDSGGGMPGFSWAATQREVSTFTRACWYDRAGYGWSDPAPAPHTSADAARDLHALLNAAHIPAPYVLVGHSIGGLNVRVYAGMFRQDVAGVVLVDASHEDVDQRIPRGRPRIRLPAPFRPVFEMWMATLRQTGVLRLMANGSLTNEPQPVSLSAMEWRTIQQLATLANAVQASATEWFQRSAEQAREAGGLGDRPLLVLTAGRVTGRDAAADEDHRAWIQLQAEMVRLSARGRQVIVANSGHLMPFDSPEAIVVAIRDAVTDFRGTLAERSR